MRLLLTLVVAFVVVVVGAIAVRSTFALPRPTGSIPIGTTTFSLDRPPEAGEASPGRFTVQVWYPAQPSTDRAPYGTGGPGIKRWIRHRVVLTRSARDTAFATLPRRSSVLVYVAGWGGERTGNTVLIENLASHGFVVAAVGDTDFDDPPLNRLAGPPDFTSHRAYEATLELGGEKLRYESARASAILDHLAALDADDPSGRFTHRLDLSRVGILGFSFGGAVALETCRRDPRFKAAMNMDGWLFDAAAGYHGGVPYFLVSDRSPTPSPDDVTSADPVHRYTSQLTVLDEKQQYDVLRRGGYALRIAGADHLSFVDLPLSASLHKLGRGRFDPERLGRAVQEYALAFFDQALNGMRSPLLAPAESDQASMTFASWPLRAAR